MNKLLIQYAICQAELTRLETACAESEARHGAWEMPCHRHRNEAIRQMDKALRDVVVYLVDTYSDQAQQIGLSYELRRGRIIFSKGFEGTRGLFHLLDGLCAGRLRRKYNDSVHVPLLAMMDAVNA